MKNLMRVLGVILILGLGFVATAMAGEYHSRLKGTYALNTVASCTQASGYTLTIHLQGQLTFNGDGTGESGGIALVTQHNPAITGSDPPSLKSVSGSFTYSVESDNYFTLDSNNFTVNGIVTIIGIAQEGWIGHGAQTLLISDTDLNVETLYRPNGSIITTRTCGRTGTAVKLPKK